MAGLEAILVTVAALLPIVNPLGSAPIFLAHSADLPPAARQQLAWVVARNAFLLLVIAMLVGSHLLAFFGISIPIVRVAGGLVLAGDRLAAAARRRCTGRAAGHDPRFLGTCRRQPRFLPADL